MDNHHNRSGFTLIEMSIVLAIIGLVLGGIAVGTSMVRNAEVRSVLSEYDTYLNGIKEYHDKYLALPGDDKNATTYWPGTANGDGSGTIGAAAGLPPYTGAVVDTAGSVGGTGEWFLAWQHLALAGFIPGRFTGIGTTTATVGTNVPASKLHGAGWTLLFYLNTTGDAGLWSPSAGCFTVPPTDFSCPPYGHLLNLGGNVAGDYTKGAILTPTEAQGIDTKMDDGMPGTGNILAWRTSVLANCTCNDTSQTAMTYNTTSGGSCTAYTGNACALVFLLGL